MYGKIASPSPVPQRLSGSSLDNPIGTDIITPKININNRIIICKALLFI